LSEGRLRRKIAAFYAVTLLASWSTWAPWVAAVNGHPLSPSSPYLHLLGSMGPAVGTVFVLWRSGGRLELRRLLRRTATKQAAQQALVWAVLIPSAAFLVVVGVSARAAGTSAHWLGLGAQVEYPELGLAAYVLASLVFYGFGEELGWRGWLYPALRGRFRPLTAALLVVPFWAFWHLPLFFATASYRAMGVGGAAGWLVSLLSGGLLTSWLTDRAGGSVLPAAVLHAVLDVYFLAEVGVPTQSALGAIVSVAGLAAAIRISRPAEERR
jgi:membrane protease YdiL (CAAX protease family)